jgi:hypothetical protein
MHYLDPRKENARVLLTYRNFMSGNSPQCHIGLGINALHTAKVLRKHRIHCDIEGVWEVAHIDKALTKHQGITHCFIEAPWISAIHMAGLMHRWQRVHFIVRAHSQIGFLQVEPGAIKIMRDLMHMQEGALNLTVAANAKKLSSFMERVYLGRVLYLPNLYDLDRPRARNNETRRHRMLRIGSFGALRILKNHTTAAAAALLIAEREKTDLEFWVSTNREEHGKGVLQSLRNMFEGLNWAKLIENQWEPWASFRRTIGNMDLCLQASMTETFNITSADAVAEGVPVVGGSAIEWLPQHWMADIDSPEDMARKGAHLLHDPHSVDDGQVALNRFCKEGTEIWLNYLDTNPA